MISISVPLAILVLIIVGFVFYHLGVLDGYAKKHKDK